MNLRPELRARFAAELVAELKQISAVRDVQLRGSLARGTEDCYSDIDLSAIVDPGALDCCLGEIPQALEAQGRLLSFRYDPEWRLHPERRVLFVAYADLPLFWRIDLDISSALGDTAETQGLTEVTDWSFTESALWNGVGALKAWARGNSVAAEEMLDRAFARANVTVAEGSVLQRTVDLASAVMAGDGQLAELAFKLHEAVALVAANSSIALNPEGLSEKIEGNNLLWKSQ